MTNNPDELRADIELTRAELGSDVDALADKVTPSKIAHRQVGKMRSAMRSARDHVMGAAEDVTQRGSAAADSMADAAETAKRKVEGNPLAVGLIAFGVGWLAASLIPASEREKRMASNVKEAAQPVIDEVAEVAGDVASDLKQPAQDAAKAVKESAAEAVDDVRDEASSAATGVTEQARTASERLRNE